ncbi:MAG: hypothetical protein D3915_08970 [Candidatus Electrothrix sp. AU1_5]|nr:hypothetical protein [Candidatus Electrothrix gigas]
MVGIIPRMKTDIFPMRHLGVTPHQEYGAAATSGAVGQLAAIAWTGRQSKGADQGRLLPVLDIPEAQGLVI